MTPVQDTSVRESFARFADELSAHRYLETVLWPNGMRCPRCGSEGRIGKLNGESTRVGAYKCYACRKSFSVTYGTLFSSSHVPVHKWLQAIYLTDGGTKPVRPHHLQHILNVSFKTASSIIRRLSAAAAELQAAESEKDASDGHCQDAGQASNAAASAPGDFPAPASDDGKPSVPRIPSIRLAGRRARSKTTAVASDTTDRRHAEDDLVVAAHW